MHMPVIEVVQKVWVPDIPDVELPYEDGEPLESHWHRLQINLLGDMLSQYWQARTDFFAGGNMFVYYCLEQARTRSYRGPDFFVVLGVDGTRPRRSWIVWQEGGRYPDVIIELLSPTTKAEDLGIKKDLYERVFKTAEYFCVDPDEQTLRGWQLEKTGYVLLSPDAHGWLWSDKLHLWLGLQGGSFQGTPGLWLRFFEPSGTLVPTAEEVAEAERARAQAERARAEAERTRAEAEHARAEAAEADNARLRAELERLRGATS
jgi:Uma2 family endonuclease